MLSRTTTSFVTFAHPFEMAGYAVAGDSGEAIVVPANAYLDRSGIRWECDRNFRKLKGACVLSN